MNLKSKKMNTSRNKIPIVEFGEVKFVPAVLKPTTWQLERRRAHITRRDGFAREWKILRAGSEGVSPFGRLCLSFRPRPPRSLKNNAKRLVRESEMESRK